MRGRGGSMGAAFRRTDGLAVLESSLQPMMGPSFSIRRHALLSPSPECGRTTPALTADAELNAHPVEPFTIPSACLKVRALTGNMHFSCAVFEIFDPLGFTCAVKHREGGQPATYISSITPAYWCDSVYSNARPCMTSRRIPLRASAAQGGSI